MQCTKRAKSAQGRTHDGLEAPGVLRFSMVGALYDTVASAATSVRMVILNCILMDELLLFCDMKSDGGVNDVDDRMRDAGGSAFN